MSLRSQTLDSLDLASIMSLDSSAPIVTGEFSEQPTATENNDIGTSRKDGVNGHNDCAAETPLNRRNRPSRACTLRAAQRLQQLQAAERRQKQPAKKDRRKRRRQEEEESEEENGEVEEQCAGAGGSTRSITPLVGTPEPSQLPRWSLRSMWELASILNFLHVFRHLLKINVEFSAEEFETALITPNDTLSDIHMPLLKAIPPITRMALTRNTWITVLCRKLRDWWYWVAEGDLPVVASHGLEIETYKSLDPGTRVVILKALCDIRVEQEDIKSYIDSSIKHGFHLSAFRKERVGGDSHGVHYWYEDDPAIGQRLYREIRKVEVKNPKAKGSRVVSNTTYLWETVATNFEEFQDVSEKLFSSKNRTEASLGKKLKIDMLPDIEKEHKRKERLLKKQHRQALLLDNFLVVDGFGAGRSLRDRKPVRYTFDDYDRSINEAIKITKKKPSSPEPNHRREAAKPEPSSNGRWPTSPHASETTNSYMSPKSPDYDDVEEHKSGPLDRSNRRRQRPQRYSAKEYVETLSDNDVDFDSDDDIVGEAIYDEEYLRKRKQRKFSSSSEGDEEYRWDEDNGEDEEEEEDSLSVSEDSDEHQKFKKLPGRTRRETKSRSVGDLQYGLRRSKRATRNRINYRQYELSDSEVESMRPEKSKPPDEHTEESENEEYSAESMETEGNNDDDQEVNSNKPLGSSYPEMDGKGQNQPPEISNSPSQDESEGLGKRCFLDLNELAPVTGFDDGINPAGKDDDKGDL